MDTELVTNFGIEQASAWTVLQLSMCITVCSWVLAQMYGATAGSESSEGCVSNQLEFRSITTADIAFDIAISAPASSDRSIATTLSSVPDHSKRPSATTLSSALRSSCSLTSAICTTLANFPNRRTSWGRRLRPYSSLGSLRARSRRCTSLRRQSGGNLSRRRSLESGYRPEIIGGRRQLSGRRHSRAPRSRSIARCHSQQCRSTVASKAPRPSLSFNANAEILCYMPADTDGFDHVSDQFWGSMPTKTFDGPSAHKALRKSHSDCGATFGEAQCSWEDQCSQIVSLMSCQRCSLLWSSEWQ